MDEGNEQMTAQYKGKVVPVKTTEEYGEWCIDQRIRNLGNRWD
jgi:hypothetical protein